MDRLQAFDPQAELTFYSPSLREEFGAVGIAMLSIWLLITLILSGMLAFAAGIPWAVIGFIVIMLTGFASLVVILIFWRGKVVLGQDGLVETNGLNASRRFGYDQIFDFKNGAHANTLVIYYYPYLKDGTIDTYHPKRTRLISVKNDLTLKTALAQRITAPRAGAPAGNDRLVAFILLVFLLVVFLILWFWGLNLY